MNHQIKNIIFDFGGVIIPIDPMAYAAGMLELGCSDIAALHERFLREETYIQFEKGDLSPEEFRNMMRTGMSQVVTDAQLDHAWNMIIGEIPQHRVTFLEKLRHKYRTFLLSNTNRIHYDYYQHQFSKKYVGKKLDDLFEEAYYSFQIGLYKPDPAIFEYVLNDSGLVAGETVFIDDFRTNIEAARKCGLQAIHLDDGLDVTEVLREI